MNTVFVQTNVRRPSPIVTTHAVKRARQRFKIGGSNADVRNWISSKLRHAEYIGLIANKEGDPGRLFVFKDFAAVLNVEEDRVTTVIKFEAPASIQTKVSGYLRKCADDVNEKMAELDEHYTVEFAKLNYEKATLKLRLLSAKSQPKRLALKARIEAIEATKGEMYEDLVALQSERTTLLKGVAAYSG